MYISPFSSFRSLSHFVSISSHAIKEKDEYFGSIRKNWSFIDDDCHYGENEISVLAQFQIFELVRQTLKSDIIFRNEFLWFSLLMTALINDK